ncbi:MAG: ABC transporter ATP-binding protein [Pseudobacteriovorax sp.]|nr:ABC transporter ATP-binding protein [Pseudobacteriovorax sp.]
MIVEFRQVSKKYNESDGLNPTDFSVREGQVIGLFGLNGSGKTTTLKLISGLLQPDNGRVIVANGTPRKNSQQISYLGDKMSFFPWMTTKDIRSFMSVMFDGFNPSKFDELSQSLEVPQKAMGQMSKGQMQRLRLVATMSRQAQLYLLDEPLSGIDLVSRSLIIETLIDVWDKQSAVIISTHEIKEIENFFDRALYLKAGTLVEDVIAEEVRKDNKSLTDLFIEINRDGVN